MWEEELMYEFLCEISPKRGEGREMPKRERRLSMFNETAPPPVQDPRSFAIVSVNQLKLADCESTRNPNHSKTTAEPW